jgi:predicted dehydrogenase
MGRLHLDALVKDPRCEVLAVADIRPGLARASAELQRVPHFYEDWSSLLQRNDIDMVDIVVPHHLHSRLALEGLRAGKHVICEKPGGLTSEELDHALATAAAFDRVFQVKFYQRYSRVNRRIREVIAEGQLGTPLLARAFFASNRLPVINEPANWRGNRPSAGGGVLIDVGIHMVDVMHELFGDVSAVSARCLRTAANQSGGVEDIAAVRMEFASGVMGDLSCLWSDTSLPFRWTREIYGTEGSLEVREVGGRQTIRLASGGAHVWEEVFNEAWDTTNATALAEAVGAVINGDRGTESGNKARRTLRTVLAAYKSDRSGTTVHPDGVTAHVLGDC